MYPVAGSVPLMHARWKCYFQTILITFSDCGVRLPWLGAIRNNSGAYCIFADRLSDRAHMQMVTNNELTVAGEYLHEDR